MKEGNKPIIKDAKKRFLYQENAQTYIYGTSKKRIFKKIIRILDENLEQMKKINGNKPYDGIIIVGKYNKILQSKIYKNLDYDAPIYIDDMILNILKKK